MTELAACDARTQTVVADTNGVILERVRKVILALGHSSNKYTDALFGAQRLDVILDSHNRGFVTERHLAAVWRQMVGDWVLDDFEKLLLRVSGTDGESVQKLNHETGEALESSRNANRGVDLN